MDFRYTQIILGNDQATESEQPLIDLLKQHLSLDNNKLREDFVCSMFGYTPSYGGAGHPDGYKPDGTPIDNKSGPNIIFPDGSVSITKKLDWDVLVHQFTPDGQLIYVVEVKVIDLIDELIESTIKQKKKGGRVSPSVPYTVWIDKPSTTVLYKNPSLFDKKKNGDFKKMYQQINKLPTK
jgi:hypothetical protein